MTSAIKVTGPGRRTRMNSWRTAIVLLALALVTSMVFWPLRSHDFVSYDDDKYVTANTNVRAGLTVKRFVWAFTTSHAANWHPLTWLSHMVDVQLFGLQPGKHHLVNLLLHIACTMVLFLTFRNLTGALWRSGFLAALFAVHPLHVESVAWVAERKDVLSAFWNFLALAAYLQYLRKPGWQRYALLTAAFTLSLLSKPMSATLPFVLLLLDWWPLGRFPRTFPGHVPWSLLIEKIPLFGLTAAISVMTYIAQRASGAVEEFRFLPLSLRLANAALAYATYAVKLFWPSNLAVLYPHPGFRIVLWQAGLLALVLGILTVVAVRASSKQPYLAIGWLWYLGTLVPVIGLVQVGFQGMADRYTYVPIIGLFIILCWAVPELMQRFPRWRVTGYALAMTALMILGQTAHSQVGYWRNSFTLFTRALEVTRDNGIMLHSMAVLLSKEGKASQALPYLKASGNIKPYFAHELPENRGQNFPINHYTAQTPDKVRSNLRSTNR